MIVKLTDSFIRTQLICPEGVNRIEYVSDDKSGLFCEVRSSSKGGGTWYVRYKNAENKTTHKRLGKTIDIDLATAKEMTRVIRAEIELGRDPRLEEKKLLAVLTLHDFYYQHYDPFARLNKRSHARDEEIFRLRIDKKFGSRRLNDITRMEIQKFHGSLITEGLAPATANHHVKLLKRLYNLAISWDLTTSNPASKIRLYTEDNQIENLLDDTQLKRLVSVLKTEKPRMVCQLLMFLLCTGCRFSEAALSTYDQFDLKNRLWKIPSKLSKSKKVRTVPLNDAALNVISELETKGTSEYLFINTKTKKPYTTIAKSWAKIKLKANLPKELRGHDLRHNFASLLVNAGESLYVVQQILGHSTPVVTQRYAHLNVNSLQKASNVASEKIMAGL